MPTASNPTFFDQPNGSCTTVFKDSCNNTESSSTVPTTSVVGGFQKDWTNTAGYWDKKSAGTHLSTNHFAYSKSVDSRHHGSFTYRELSDACHSVTVDGYTDGNSYTTKSVVAPDGFDVMSDEVFTRLSSKHLSDIKQSDVNLAQDLVEWRQTTDLFLSTAKQIAGSYMALRKGDFLTAARVLGILDHKRVQVDAKRFRKELRNTSHFAIAQWWLALIYGWRPLLSDLFGSLQILSESLYGQKIHKVVSVSKDTGESTTYSSFGLGNALTDRVRTVWRYHCKMSTTFSVDNNAVRTTSQLGITNPVDLVWELLPYSFVVDWFVPIGTYLSNFDATLGLSFLSGTKSFRFYTKRESTLLGGTGHAPGTSGTYNYSGSAVGTIVKEEVGRDPLTAFPSNPIPRFKSPVSPIHIVNGLTLLTNAFK